MNRNLNIFPIPFLAFNSDTWFSSIGNYFVFRLVQSVFHFSPNDTPLLVRFRKDSLMMLFFFIFFFDGEIDWIIWGFWDFWYLLHSLNLKLKKKLFQHWRNNITIKPMMLNKKSQNLREYIVYFHIKFVLLTIETGKCLFTI